MKRDGLIDFDEFELWIDNEVQLPKAIFVTQDNLSTKETNPKGIEEYFFEEQTEIRT